MLQCWWLGHLIVNKNARFITFIALKIIKAGRIYFTGFLIFAVLILLTRFQVLSKEMLFPEFHLRRPSNNLSVRCSLSLRSCLPTTYAKL